MADWYVSSAAYATLPAWAATTAYTVGQIIKPLTVVDMREHVYRCTTAGTSSGTEPTWSTAYGDGATRTDGTVTWTNVSAKSVYGWAAACKTLGCLCYGPASSTRLTGGDRVFLSSDHSEATTSAGGIVYILALNNSFLPIYVISVNRAGSVPPVAADRLPGATISFSVNSNSFALDNANTCMYWEGITVNAGTGDLILSNSGQRSHYFKNCALKLTSAGGARFKNNMPCKVVLDNTTCQFASGAGSAFGWDAAAWDLTWMNTPSGAIVGTPPTILFQHNQNKGIMLFTGRGVDLSPITGNLYTGTTLSQIRVLLDSCKIAAGLTRYPASPGSVNSDEVELVNCFDGTNILNERYNVAGNVITERSVTLVGGATDDTGLFSLKLTGNGNASLERPLDSFWLDVENAAVGVSKTATVEIISSATLNNTHVQLLLEYMGTSGSPLASFVNSLDSVMTPAAALPTSSMSWNNPPATPVKQYLQVAFTPQCAGRVRALVRLAKTSTTMWVNPQLTIT